MYWYIKQRGRALAYCRKYSIKKDAIVLLKEVWKMANNNQEQPFMKYYKVSQWIGASIRWLLLFVVIALVVRLFVVKPISYVLHSLFDSDPIYNKIRQNPNGYMSDLFPSAPHTKDIGNNFDNTWLFDISNFLASMMTLFFILLAVYMLLILLRHRNGEHAPFLNDLEARRLKRKMINNVGAKRKAITDENYSNSKGGNKKQLPKKERLARRRIRASKIEIHTFYKPGIPKPLKTYQVWFKRIKNKEINKVMLKKIEDLEDELSVQTDASFSAIEQIGYHYSYRADKQLEKDKESFIVKMRKRQMAKEEEIEEADEDAVQFSYPLTLFADNTEKIESQKVKAEAYAEQLRESISIHLTSKNISTEKDEYFTENTAVELHYKLPANLKKMPDVSNLETSINTLMDVEGTSVQLRGRKIIIIIPLPKTYQIPIDVKSMMEEIY